MAESSLGADHQGLVKLAASTAELILAFYRSTGTQNAQLDAQIKRFQNSDISWRVAQILFEHQDPSVRYIAALTFEVNVRKAHRLSRDEARERAWKCLTDLLQCLLSCLKRCDSFNVMRKICTTLGVWSVMFHSSWMQAETEDLLSGWRSPLLMIQKLMDATNQDYWQIPGREPNSFQVVYRFRIFFALVDEIFTLEQRFSLEGPDSSWLSTWREANLATALEILRSPIVLESHNIDLQIAAIEVAPLLLKIAAQPDHVERSFIPEILNFLMYSLQIEDLRASAENAFKALIEESPTVLADLPLPRIGDYLLQRSSVADNRFLIDELDSTDAVEFGNLLVPYAVQAVQAWGPPPPLAIDIAIVELLVSVMNGRGIPGIDDDVFGPCLEFWYHVTDLAADQEGFANESWGAATLSKAVTNLLKRLAETNIPESEKDRALFQQFRNDCKDWLADAIPLLYPSLLGLFLELLDRSHRSSDIRGLETLLFVLQAAPLDTRTEIQAEMLLDAAFDLLQHFPVLHVSQAPLGNLVQSTMIDFIGAHDTALEHHPHRVQAALTFLFVAVKSERHSLKAATAIFRISDLSRRFLFSRLNDILDAYQTLYYQNDLTSETKPLLLGAMACLIEAVPLCQQSIDAMSKIIQWIEIDTTRWQDTLNSRSDIESGDVATSILVCLRNVARGLQEQAIDLDAAGDSGSDKREQWLVLGGPELQRRVTSIIHTLWGMSNAPVYLTAETCNILRKGYPESKPGLFVFPPQITYDLFNASNIDSGFFEIMLSTLQAMLNSPNEAFHSERSIVARTSTPKLLQVIAFLLSKPVGEDIPLEIAMLELISTYVVKQTTSMTSAEYRYAWNEILAFSLRSIQLPDLLPRRKGLHLWATMIEKLKDSAELLLLVTPHGPRLAAILFNLVSGGALRSELENITITIQKLVMFGNVPGQWLNHAILNNAPPPGVREQSSEERMRLKARLLATRSSLSKMKLVVKDWWQSCRGGIML